MLPGPMVRKMATLALVTVALAGCARSPEQVGDLADLPLVTGPELEAHLASLDRPAVVNIWASWCLPCRSEAPLLSKAAEMHGDEIAFIGVDVQDSQEEAKAFMVEYGLTGLDHFFDPSRSVPDHYKTFGTPVTLFFAPGGELIRAHEGIVDERTLALDIDELLRLVP